MPVELHNVFLFYQEDEETKDIDEMVQPMQNPPPSPLNETQEDFEEQASGEQQDPTRQTLKERLHGRIAIEMDPNIKANLQWKLQVVVLAEQRFFQVEQIYKTHCQKKMPLTMIKIELDKNTKSHMPLCRMEETGGYAPLTED